MTLGSALPWRARSTLGRIQHFQPFQHKLALAGPSPQTIRHGLFLRAQSTKSTQSSQSTGHGAASAPKPHFPYRDPSAEYSAPEEPTDAPSSLMDRLAVVPVRRHGNWDPVIVKPITPYPHKREHREGLQRYHRELTQQARMEAHRENGQAGDWRLVLQTLMKWGETYVKPKDGVKIVIPRDSAELLLSEHGENSVWSIRERTNCAMTLYQPLESGADAAATEEGEGDGDGEGDPYIMLNGQPRAVSAAIDDILEVTKRVTIVRIQGATREVIHAGQPPTDGSVTATLIFGHRTQVPNRPYTLNMRADQIPLPSEWTTATFHRYIAALTLGRPYGSLASKLYRRGESHQDTVVQQLHLVFSDPDASAAMSLPAVKLALQYLERKGETYIGDARALFQHMVSSGLRMDTEVNNLMLEAAVKAKNLAAFQARLNDMIRAGHKPNVRSWLLFLRLIQAEEVRRYILYAMHSKGYFTDPHVVNCVAVDMADHDIYRAIQLNQDLPTFFAGLRQAYGSKWELRTRAANRYMDVLGRYSKFPEMQLLLEHMLTTEHGKPNTITLNTILTHCKHQHKIDAAVAFIRLFEHHRDCKNLADRVTFHLLFEMARKTRKPHFLSAAWRYAHLVEMAESRLRLRGWKLLMPGPEVKYLTDRLSGLWEKNLIKSDISKAEFMERLMLCDCFAVRPDATRIRRLGSTEKYRAFARWAFEKSQWYGPKVSLGKFLQAALDRDRALHELAHEGVGEVHEGLPAAMWPVPLPIRRLRRHRFELGSLPGWLDWAKRGRKGREFDNKWVAGFKVRRIGSDMAPDAKASMILAARRGQAGRSTAGIKVRRVGTRALPWDGRVRMIGCANRGQAGPKE